MHNEISIALIPDENIFSVIPLLRVLNPAIPEGVLRSRLTEMVSQGIYSGVGPQQVSPD